MPREVWGYEEDQKTGKITQTPRKDFTPKRAPISTKYTDPAAYKKSPGLISKTQGVIGGGRQPHADPTWGKPPSGITYTEPQVTKDLNAAIQANRNRDRDRDDDGGGTTTPPKIGGGLTCAQKGMVDDGMGGCKKKDGTETGDDKCKGVTVPSCPEDKPNGNPKCVDGKIDYSDCTADPNNKTCEYGKDDNGNCKTKPDSGDDSGTPSLTTILQPDETPDLQILTDEMDLRNMLSNVLNKNNPLFKQARTRAFQAMAARGIVNSSMAEEAVMSAVMNVAMPIAQRVITDLQEVMKANVNKSNEFKMALNNMYYQELLRRVDAANTWNLERMQAQQVNWQTVLGAKVEGMGIKDDPAYERYMSMLSKLGSQPSWNVAG